MYLNLYGNKMLDFNDDSSPFSHINQLFMSTGKANVGEQVLERLAQLGGGINTKYRLCIVSKIAGGERVLTEVFYDTITGKLQVKEDRIPNEKNKFKRFFMRNINILSL